MSVSYEEALEQGMSIILHDILSEFMRDMKAEKEATDERSLKSTRKGENNV